MLSSLDKISTQILRFTPFTLALIVPLFFLPFTGDFFAFNKFYLLSILASLSLLAWCLRSLLRGKLSFTLSPSFFPLLFLVTAGIISSVWLSPTPHLSLFGQTTLFISLTLIFITVTSSQKNKTVIDSIVYGLIGSAVLLSFFTLLHRFGLVQKIFAWDVLDSKYFHPVGGVFPALLYTLPIAVATVGMSAVSKNWLTKSLLFAAIIVMIIASVINISLLFPQDKSQIISLLPLSASWSITVDTFKNWRTALLGTGPDTYLTTFTKLRPASLNSSKNIWALRFSESGSFLLTLITTFGLVGGLSFALAFLNPLRATLKYKKQMLEEPSFLFLVLSTLATFISFLVLPASITSLTLAFVSLLGLTIVYKYLGQHLTKDISFSLSSTTDAPSIYSEITSSTNLAPSNAFLPWVATVLSVTLLCLYWYFALPAYQASLKIKQASDSYKTNIMGSFLKQNEAAKLDRYNPSYQIILSQTYQSIAKYYLEKQDKTEDDKKNAVDAMQRSVDSGRLAATLDPRNPLSYENLAAIYQTFIGSADGSADYAVSHLAQAVTLDPTNPRLRLQLGSLFFNLGDPDQAIKLITQAIELKRDWDIPYFNLAAIYKNKKDYSKALQFMKAGSQLTDPTSSDYSKIQDELKAIEKLVPPSATSSANTTK